MKLNARTASQQGLVLGQCRERHKDADFAWKPRRPTPSSMQCLVCGHGIVRTNPTREREFRVQIPGTQLERKQVVYELSSGERVQQVGIDTFILPSTGAKFVCIKE